MMSHVGSACLAGVGLRSRSTDPSQLQTKRGAKGSAAPVADDMRATVIPSSRAVLIGCARRSSMWFGETPVASNTDGRDIAAPVGMNVVEVTVRAIWKSALTLVTQPRRRRSGRSPLLHRRDAAHGGRSMARSSGALARCPLGRLGKCAT